MRSLVQKSRVLIVDDSAVLRTMLSQIISSDPTLEVVGTAADPYDARQKLVELKPDLMILDVEMPKMDGITFLEKVMRHFPTRTILFSSMAQTGSEIALKAIELGAVDVIPKPIIDAKKGLDAFSGEFLRRVRLAAKANLPVYKPKSEENPPTVIKGKKIQSRPANYLIAVASSTGGIEALKKILPALPADFPAILVVQHMPPNFTKALAEALNKQCAMEVKEAKDGDAICHGQVFVAPGDFHMEVEGRSGNYYIKLHQKPYLHSVRPAADYLLKSVAQNANGLAMGVILTGMGKDGAEGLMDMKKHGCFTLAQDKETCTVFGMPKAAIDMGAVNKVLPLEQIAGELLHQLKAKKIA
jgi:two-component system, chemotaxis family, protein-glutamate methylesterase/glutaminase